MIHFQTNRNFGPVRTIDAGGSKPKLEKFEVPLSFISERNLAGLRAKRLAYVSRESILQNLNWIENHTPAYLDPASAMQCYIDLPETKVEDMCSSVIWHNIDTSLLVDIENKFVTNIYQRAFQRVEHNHLEFEHS